MEKALQAAVNEALKKWNPKGEGQAGSDGPSTTTDGMSNGTSPITEVDAGIKDACEMLLTLVAFPTCLLCGDFLSKENEKSCNLVLCPCGHCVCYLCGRTIMKTSEMANWEQGHEVFNKVHEENPGPEGTPACCVPASPAAEAEHLACRVAKSINQLFTPLDEMGRLQAYHMMSKLAEELTK